MAEDAIERLSFVRHEAERAFVIGDATGVLTEYLRGTGCEVTRAAIAEFDEAEPWPKGGHDFIAVLGGLDTVNDLPGALIHMRAALAPGGLAIAA